MTKFFLTVLTVHKSFCPHSYTKLMNAFNCVSSTELNEESIASNNNSRVFSELFARINSQITLKPIKVWSIFAGVTKNGTRILKLSFFPTSVRVSLGLYVEFKSRRM